MYRLWIAIEAVQLASLFRQLANQVKHVVCESRKAMIRFQRLVAGRLGTIVLSTFFGNLANAILVARIK